MNADFKFFKDEPVSGPEAGENTVKHTEVPKSVKARTTHLIFSDAVAEQHGIREATVQVQGKPLTVQFTSQAFGPNRELGAGERLVWKGPETKVRDYKTLGHEGPKF